MLFIMAAGILTAFIVTYLQIPRADERTHSPHPLLHSCFNSSHTGWETPAGSPCCQGFLLQGSGWPQGIHSHTKILCYSVIHRLPSTSGLSCFISTVWRSGMNLLSCCLAKIELFIVLSVNCDGMWQSCLVRVRGFVVWGTDCLNTTLIMTSHWYYCI